MSLEHGNEVAVEASEPVTEPVTPILLKRHKVMQQVMSPTDNMMSPCSQKLLGPVKGYMPYCNIILLMSSTDMLVEYFIV